jgi:hypothetical protein
LRKVGLLQGTPQAPLAGRITALLDLGSRLPFRVWFEPDPKAHEQNHWPQLLAALPAQALVIFDLGYTQFRVFAELTAAHVTWITRAKKNLAFTLDSVIEQSSTVRDLRIVLGEGDSRQTVRLIEMYFQGTWYRYLTNELNPRRLPAVYAVLLYRQRWRIEADLRSLHEPWADTTSPAGRMVLTVFAGIAEFERELIHERTRTGRVAAKARGVRFGRPPKLSADQLGLAERLIGEGRSIPEIAKLLKVHRATLYRAVKA